MAVVPVRRQVVDAAVEVDSPAVLRPQTRQEQLAEAPVVELPVALAVEQIPKRVVPVVTLVVPVVDREVRTPSVVVVVVRRK